MNNKNTQAEGSSPFLIFNNKTVRHKIGEDENSYRIRPVDICISNGRGH